MQWSMPWHAWMQKLAVYRMLQHAMLYAATCGAKIEIMMQHEGEHAEACEQSSKVRIEYVEAYEHVCRGMGLEAGKK